MNIKERLKSKLFPKPLIKEPTLNDVTDPEIELIYQLRDDIQQLNFKPNANSSWENNRYQLKKHILLSDPRNFLKWPFIIGSMFWEADKVEFDELSSSKLWTKFIPAIKESKIGTPTTYQYYPDSSGNLVHHAYSLLQIMEKTSINIDKINKVFEFGGGYGSFCRLLYQYDYSGSYTILDLPEFSCLQKYYLNSIELKNPLNISLNATKYENRSVNLINQINEPEEFDAFIGLWSISEVPTSLREEIFSKLKNLKYILIAFQGSFAGVDNLLYFNDFKKEFPDFKWEMYPIKHLPFKDHYLIGEKN